MPSGGLYATDPTFYRNQKQPLTISFLQGNRPILKGVCLLQPTCLPWISGWLRWDATHWSLLSSIKHMGSYHNPHNWPFLNIHNQSFFTAHSYGFTSDSDKSYMQTTEFNKMHWTILAFQDQKHCSWWFFIVFEALLPPRSLTVRPWKWTIPIGKACLPTTIFQGRTVKLPGCNMDFSYHVGSSGPTFNLAEIDGAGGTLTSSWRWWAKECLNPKISAMKRMLHQEFQVPKMEGFLNLIYGYFGVGFSLT